MAGKPAAALKERNIVIDEKNMFLLWLEEKVAQRQLTPTQGDKMLQEYETKGKTWVGPFKDTAGTIKLTQKLAKDMKTWYGARIYFTSGKHGDLVIIKGWPAGRKLLPGTRYKVTNPKIVELQIGKPGLRAAAKESARFGLILVVAVDVADYILRDNATIGQLFGSLTVDIPSVAIASALGAAAGSWAAGTAVIGAIACGPVVVALVAGVAVGLGLLWIDQHFGLTEKLSDAYDSGLAKLDRVRHELGAAAEQRFRQLENSKVVHDLSQEAHVLAAKLGRESDYVIKRLRAL